MRKFMSLLLALCLAVSFSGCKKELTTEQKIANLEQSSRELEEAARITREEADRARQEIQDYLDAYAKAGGK